MNLKGVMITKQDEIFLARRLCNWIGLSKFLATASEEETIKLLKMEVEGKGRLDIVHRLHSRFNTLRRDREKKELAGIVHGSR